MEKEFFILWMEIDRYEGDYKNDKWEGKGVYYYNSGIFVIFNMSSITYILAYFLLYKQNHFNAIKFEFFFKILATK
jgi:hypothetical protein